MRALMLLAALWLTGMARAGDAPPDSLYQLDLHLESQDGIASGLDLARGAPVLITMFYASCPYTCPAIIAAMRELERQLPATSRQELRVLLVSIDPEHDTPEVLHELAQRHRADPARWTFARVPADEVRELAAVLGVRYRELPDGGFNHSAVITLLDRDGRVLQQTSKLTAPDPEFAAALRAATATSR